MSEEAKAQRILFISCVFFRYSGIVDVIVGITKRSRLFGLTNNALVYER
jgi:hypothetical protein